MQIKLLPEKERPAEKAWLNGVESLSNTELLALIIHTGTKDKSALRLAEDVLGTLDGGIGELGRCCKEELTEIDGIGKMKACTIMAAVELGKRISTNPAGRKLSASSSEDVAALFMEELRYLQKEHFRSVLVNAKGDILSVDKVSVGELSSTVVHPREVFAMAVKKSAAAVIFVHNHPSGDPTPSMEDIDTTQRLVEAGQILGIRVLDHIIIGDGKYESLRRKGIIT
ncbi:MAG: DNA repair protein RadC [Clostridia bacterium]|nr:DNA repair protein RadC [Clostridia bacterium]MDO5303439.1 DNA repair protein RadC [Clostridia bacterium]